MYSQQQDSCLPLQVRRSSGGCKLLMVVALSVTEVVHVALSKARQTSLHIHSSFSPNSEARHDQGDRSVGGQSIGY